MIKKSVTTITIVVPDETMELLARYTAQLGIVPDKTTAGPILMHAAKRLMNQVLEQQVQINE